MSKTNTGCDFQLHWGIYKHQSILCLAVQSMRLPIPQLNNENLSSANREHEGCALERISHYGWSEHYTSSELDDFEKWQ